ncbi:hypothetical protein L486_04892 [Kwoniella mangroviensis CBS 10435]|uniref:Lariat debranching enzyme C-terminal domain-containing protein n=1 Tax=Kwoniella mangroviensis CBS 10435 TaxID=1331196 RepID=A0A1B9IPV5_9TREE|nr:hypothetical protein L486_04892 [Kwoniella mangroviensis CBS 10435]
MLDRFQNTRSQHPEVKLDAYQSTQRDILATSKETRQDEGESYWVAEIEKLKWVIESYFVQIAVQGCSHGSLTAIYDTVQQYTLHTSKPIDLLLLCGDFQALRSTNDFASLAVPPKYHSLGTFHEYYSGLRKAPVLTIVIGGNHEASNYMWELYHGGWLAENIYYMGAGGSVYVDGLRIVGASGIYKDHDYRKGHFEKVPYNNSTLRSVYHIREYDVMKLMQLSCRDDSIFLSHDWPTSIARHGDTGALLRRKPFFRDEINKNTLGSPPLFTLLNHIQPSYWFSAHLHVKFAALYDHSSSTTQQIDKLEESLPSMPSNGEVHVEKNPDEIAIDNEDEFDLPPTNENSTPSGNPDEIAIEDDEFDDPPTTTTTDAAGFPAITTESSTTQKDLKIDESVDIVEKATEEGIQDGITELIGAPINKVEEAVNSVEEGKPEKAEEQGRRTKFLALDKCGPGKDFIQFFEIPTPSSSTSDHPPRLIFDPEWLAISRAFHPYLSTTINQTPLPSSEILKQLVSDERQRIEEEGLLVPSANVNEDGTVDLVWTKGPIEIERVQKFWPTAPSQSQLPPGPDGNLGADQWYTNPQTEAFCGLLGLQNRVNPAPI